MAQRIAYHARRGVACLEHNLAVFCPAIAASYSLKTCRGKNIADFGILLQHFEPFFRQPLLIYYNF